MGNASQTNPNKGNSSESITDAKTLFLNVVQNDDNPINLVLKSHLIAEYHLNRLISEFLPRGDIIVDLSDKGKFSFNNKIALVESFDCLSKNLVDSLKKLNTLRNNCSHSLEYDVQEKEIDAMGRPFGKDYSKTKKVCEDKVFLLKVTLTLLISKLHRAIDIHLNK